MRLEQLAVLIEVVKYKSLNLACVPLHMTQQTLSACIKSMERELGVDILKRSNKGISLTLAGKKVLAYALMVVPEYQKHLKKIRKKLFTANCVFILIHFFISPPYLKLL